MGQLTSLVQHYRRVKSELNGSTHPLIQYYRHESFELINIWFSYRNPNFVVFVWLFVLISYSSLELMAAAHECLSCDKLSSFQSF